MTNKEFKAKLVLLGLNQGTYARLINSTDNTISTMLKLKNVPPIHVYAILGIEQSINKGKLIL